METCTLSIPAKYILACLPAMEAGGPDCNLAGVHLDSTGLTATDGYILVHINLALPITRPVTIHRQMLRSIKMVDGDVRIEIKYDQACKPHDFAQKAIISVAQGSHYWLGQSIAARYSDYTRVIPKGIPAGQGTPATFGAGRMGDLLKAIKAITVGDKLPCYRIDGYKDGANICTVYGHPEATLVIMPVNTNAL